MSRYLIEGIRRDVESGKCVAIIGNTRREAKGEFEDIVQAGDPWDAVSRTNGKESAWFRGGSVYVVTADPRAVRGRTFDVAVLLGGLRSLSLEKSNEFFRALRPTGAELIATD